MQLALGLDAGGTQTRWALADRSGTVIAQGLAPSISGLQLLDDAGRAAVRSSLQDIAAALPAPPLQVVAGITGFDAGSVPLLAEMTAAPWRLPPSAVRTMSDIELACHAAFAPGQGYVVYAGTGSIAAFVDAAGTLHRAGGRGAIIDDAGGGHWIARQALRQIWRAEDETPGAWRHSALARRLFEQIGGADWSLTRSWVYGASRGELGLLALAVAAAADEDAQALALLQDAGRELARLGQALLQRFGARPLALAGRVLDLHPSIEASLRATLPPGTVATRPALPAHHAAARIGAQALTS